MKVYIGYDEREHEAYEVCKYSIEKHTPNVDVRPLVQSQLREQGHYWREKDEAATAFSLTRFLVPALTDYRGWAVFMDCDMLVTEDLRSAFWKGDYDSNQYAVYVVKHFHDPQESVKMDGQKQEPYPRKNWSSVMLWNCGHPKNRNLTPEVINTVQPSFLHRFQWLEDQDIGGLPLGFNFLEGYYKPFPDGKLPTIIHMTNGGPWFDTHQDVDYADVWRQYRDEMRKENG